MNSSFEYRSMKRPRSRSRSRSPSPSSSRPQPYFSRAPSRNPERERTSSSRPYPGGYTHPEHHHYQQTYSKKSYDESGLNSDPRRIDYDPLEEQRRLKMAKLRAENEAEERRLADIEAAVLNPSHDSSTIDEKPLMNDAKNKIVEIQEGELDDYDEDEQMQMLLGFSSGFNSTKGKAVEDNQTSAAKGAAAKNKARKYRQYMNRKGGFNRPLDKMN